MPALKNPKWERFAQEIAGGVPYREAYVKAGFSDNRANAYKLKDRPAIAQRITEIIQRDTTIERRAEERAVVRAAEKLEITKERILQELASIAFASPTDVMSWGAGVMVLDENGHPHHVGHEIVLKNSDDLPPHVRAAISEIRQTKEGLAVKFHPKLAAIAELNKVLGIATEKLDANVNVTLDPSGLSDVDIARRLAFVLAKGRAAAQAKGNPDGNSSPGADA